MVASTSDFPKHVSNEQISTRCLAELPPTYLTTQQCWQTLKHEISIIKYINSRQIYHKRRRQGKTMAQSNPILSRSTVNLQTDSFRPLPLVRKQTFKRTSCNLLQVVQPLLYFNQLFYIHMSSKLNFTWSYCTPDSSQKYYLELKKIVSI